MRAESSDLTVVGLGEALFDCFPQQMILGGAPLNLALHAHQLLVPIGGRGVVASRVGEDDLGARLLAELTAWGIDTAFVQRDQLHPTGRVQVTVDRDRQPTYVIEDPAAWDYMEFKDGVQGLAGTCGAVCFGTLAQRNETSRRAIHEFLAAAPQALRVYDVNLRQRYYSAETLRHSCQMASVVKLNDEELPAVTELLDLSIGNGDPNHAAQQLVTDFDLMGVALTRGAQGTVWYTADHRIEGSPAAFEREPNCDSVGAGDACCAALICGLLLEWPLKRTVDFANRVGAFVASRAGATPALPRGLLDQMDTSSSAGVTEEV